METNKSKIIDQQNALHNFWGNNCDSWVLINSEELSVKQEKMPPGAKEKKHLHTKAQQFFFILKGSATFYLENEKIIVAQKKGLLIQPKTKHYIANETLEPLEFLVISQPTTNNDRTEIE
jgi:mannose-6-phosphate isomerase-like protein (cupin superfamily)